MANIKETPAIYYPDGSTATRDQVRLKLLLDGIDPSPPPRHLTTPPTSRSFEDWKPILERRQAEYRELVAFPELVEIEIDTKKPILITPIGDVHALNPECNLVQFGRDIDLTRAVGGYFMALGDMTDSIFWQSEPGLGSNQEAILYMQSALKYMAEGGHLLAGWLGDHEGWIYDKHNALGMYADFYERFNAHLLDGISYVDIGLNNGQSVQHHAIIGSHRHKGFSIYSDSHASWRQYNDEAKTERNIISITAHNHTKGYNRQTRKVFGGEEALIHSLSLGTYKESDRYSRKHGWPRKGEETNAAFGIVLFPDTDRVEVFWNVDGAVEFMMALNT